MQIERKRRVYSPAQKAAKAAYDKARRMARHDEFLALERARRSAETPEHRERRIALGAAYRRLHPHRETKSPERKAYINAWKRQQLVLYPEKTRRAARAVRLKSRYGITIDRFEELLLIQDNKCAICRQAESAAIKGKALVLSVDHDHSCCPGPKSCGNCVRGLLCSRCNLVMGTLKDDVALLRDTIAYLERSTPTNGRHG